MKQAVAASCLVWSTHLIASAASATGKRQGLSTACLGVLQH